MHRLILETTKNSTIGNLEMLYYMYPALWENLSPWRAAPNWSRINYYSKQSSMNGKCYSAMNNAIKIYIFITFYKFYATE